MVEAVGTYRQGVLVGRKQQRRSCVNPRRSALQAKKMHEAQDSGRQRRLQRKTVLLGGVKRVKGEQGDRAIPD